MTTSGIPSNRPSNPTTNPTTSLTGSSAMDIHRLLDEAFAGVEMTRERQDLKEEIRANLVARVADLQSHGTAPGAAARRAMDELGDVRDLLDDGDPAPGAPAPPWEGEWVRSDPAFVIRAALASVVVTAAAGVLVVAATATTLSFALQVAAVVVAALAVGALTSDALCQETTSNHPVPTGRALGYGVASTLGVGGLGSGWLSVRDLDPSDLDMPWLIGGVVLILAAVVLFVYLGATQTNRHKPWVVRMQASQAGTGDRFARDPATPPARGDADGDRRKAEGRTRSQVAAAGRCHQRDGPGRQQHEDGRGGHVSQPGRQDIRPTAGPAGRVAPPVRRRNMSSRSSVSTWNEVGATPAWTGSATARSGLRSAVSAVVVSRQAPAAGYGRIMGTRRNLLMGAGAAGGLVALRATWPAYGATADTPRTHQAARPAASDRVVSPGTTLVSTRNTAST